MMKPRKASQLTDIVGAKENIMLSYQPTNGLKLYVRAVIESEAWPTVVQLKR